MNNILPPSIPNDELIAKCSPRGAGDGGNVIWTGHFSKNSMLVRGATPAKEDKKHPAMTYVMEHWASTKRHYRTIDDIAITNMYCGVSNGWDIIVYGTIIDHKDRKTDAQHEAEKLLEGQC